VQTACDPLDAAASMTQGFPQTSIELVSLSRREEATPLPSMLYWQPPWKEQVTPDELPLKEAPLVTVTPLVKVWVESEPASKRSVATAATSAIGTPRLKVASTEPALLMTAELLSTPWKVATAVTPAVGKFTPVKDRTEPETEALEREGELALSCSYWQEAGAIVFPHAKLPEPVLREITSDEAISISLVMQVKLPYPVTLTTSQMSAPPTDRLMPSVEAPKPVPETVRSCPPELPVDGEIETRVGVMLAEVNAS